MISEHFTVWQSGGFNEEGISRLQYLCLHYPDLSSLVDSLEVKECIGYGVHKFVFSFKDSDKVIVLGPTGIMCSEEKMYSNMSRANIRVPNIYSKMNIGVFNYRYIHGRSTYNINYSLYILEKLYPADNEDVDFYVDLFFMLEHIKENRKTYEDLQFMKDKIGNPVFIDPGSESYDLDNLCVYNKNINYCLCEFNFKNMSFVLDNYRKGEYDYLVECVDKFHSGMSR